MGCCFPRTFARFAGCGEDVEYVYTLEDRGKSIEAAIAHIEKSEEASYNYVPRRQSTSRPLGKSAAKRYSICHAKLLAPAENPGKNMGSNIPAS